MQIDVKISSASYPVIIESGCVDQLSGFLDSSGASSVYALIDENVARLHADLVSEHLPADYERIVIPSGEQSKSLRQLSALYDEILSGRELDRSSIIIAIGGGVVGDLAGLLAATLMRGIRCIQVPTTLLAMVDSSVGGKTAINHATGKNLIGAFHQPTAVLVDTAFLKTLPKREYVSAIAETIKSAVIGDHALFEFLKQNVDALLNLDSEPLTRVLSSCVNFKTQIIEEDERETGRRGILNYGHTVGHVLETAYPGRYLHGEAVAIGMVAANRLAIETSILDSQPAAEITQLIQQFGLPTSIPDDLNEGDLVDGMKSDKKRSSGSVNFALPTSIGSAALFPHPIDDQLVRRLLGPPDG
ncbi:MAG: 3-dehydroquinate synthase [Planctomycetota bacterium]|jgi:3-dehydroquinate synthase